MSAPLGYALIEYYFGVVANVQFSTERDHAVQWRADAIKRDMQVAAETHSIPAVNYAVCALVPITEALGGVTTPGATR